MGLETLEALRAFCLELSDDHPSPGGGSAAAAAGAMAASLLIMVCRITEKSKKHASSAEELSRIRGSLESQRDLLISLASSDAKAYDSVIEAIRRNRSELEVDKFSGDVEKALKHAAEVPLETAMACLRVLELAYRTAEIGIRRASSDVAVAVRLAEAGFHGADKNVRINLKDIEDRDYNNAMDGRLTPLEKAAIEAARRALALLENP